MNEGLRQVLGSSLSAWAGDVREIHALLSRLRLDEPGAADVLADVRFLAGDLLRDMLGHGIRPEAGQNLELVPGAPAAALASLDRLDPLPGGERRVNAATLRDLAAREALPDDEDDDDSRFSAADALDDLPQAESGLPHADERRSLVGAH